MRSLVDTRPDERELREADLQFIRFVESRLSDHQKQETKKALLRDGIDVTGVKQDVKFSRFCQGIR